MIHSFSTQMLTHFSGFTHFYSNKMITNFNILLQTVFLRVIKTLHCSLHSSFYSFIDFRWANAVKIFPAFFHLMKYQTETFYVYFSRHLIIVQRSNHREDKKNQTPNPPKTFHMWRAKQNKKKNKSNYWTIAKYLTIVIVQECLIKRFLTRIKKFLKYNQTKEWKWTRQTIWETASCIILSERKL